MNLQSSQIQNTFTELINDPDKRFQKFFNFYCDVNINPAFSVEKYYRSGKEMIRMANVYFSEQDYFYAFVLYSRYLVLYLDKIKTHSQYAGSDKSEIANINKVKFLCTEQIKTIAFPRAEKLKIFIKEFFEKEANENLKQQSQNEVKIDTTQSASIDSLNKNLEHLKRQIINDNESQLEELKQKELDSLNKHLQSERAPSARPLVDRSLKPCNDNRGSFHNFRHISIPSDLTSVFLSCAEVNTNRNVETCGILAGNLSKNSFTLTHLILPKQSGSSDTCTTESEHELFDVIDQSNLITLGWIHTHPSQTAFLSSIDLHTHYGYQIMIPEAIAIVCAPKHNETGIFVLTPDVGMKEIGDCKMSGFHPHTKVPPLFEESGHVNVNEKATITLIDLRNKK